MKKTLIISLFAFSFALLGAGRASAVSCPSDSQCGWIDVTNVDNFGVPRVTSAGENFYNDVPAGATAVHLCQVSGYDSYTYQAIGGSYSKCNDEHELMWDGSNWKDVGCASRKWLAQLYCAKKNPPANNAPTIDWTSAPDSASCNASYFIQATGKDQDGNLTAVSIDKNGSPFAYAGGGDGFTGTSENSTSDSGPQTVTYTAWASDGAGASSPTISHSVTIAACQAPDQAPTGSLSANCSALSGTAVDADTPNQGVWVHIYMDGPAGSGASIYAAPTSDASTHQFSTPYSLTGTHTFYAYAIDTSGNGNNPLIGQQTVTCNPAAQAPTGFIAASPSSLPSTGGSVTISWSVSDATSCSASGDWSGSKATSGSESVSVTKSSTFTLSCSGAGGTWSDSASVSVANPTTVVNPPSYSASLSVSSTCLTPGSSLTFTSTANGSPITSHTIEKDSNQDGVYGTLTSFGASGGRHTYSTNLGEGLYDFRTAVNGSVYSTPVRVTVSPSCAAGNNGAGNGAGGGNGTGTGGGNGGNPGPFCTGGKVPSGNSCVCPAGTVDLGGSCATPGFNVSGDSSVQIKMISTLGGTSTPASVTVNPTAGFASPVTLSVQSLRNSGGADLTTGTATFEWDNGASTETLTYDSGTGQYAGPSGIGAKLKVGVRGTMSEPYYATVVGSGGGRSATFVLEVDPRPTNPSFHEQ